MTGERLDGDPFEAQRLDGRVLVVTGAAGEHVAPAQSGASA
jgi:hypothetical protein